MQIRGFSRRTFDEAGRFFKEHPVLVMKVVRAADMASPCVRLGNGRCIACGAEIVLGKIFTDLLAEGLRTIGEEMPAKSVPADLMRAIEFTHCYDQASRSHYCGGRIEFATGGFSV